MEIGIKNRKLDRNGFVEMLNWVKISMIKIKTVFLKSNIF
jgi:hypothetical protein